MAAAVGCVAAGVPCLTPVVSGKEAANDDSTVAWLLACSLAEAREEEGVKLLEEKVAEAESRLLEELEQHHGVASQPKTPQAWAALSRVKQAAVLWYVARIRVMKRKEKGRKKRKKMMRRWSRWSNLQAAMAVLEATPVSVCMGLRMPAVSRPLHLCYRTFLPPTGGVFWVSLS